MLILLNYILVNLIWAIEPLANKYFLKYINISTLMFIISTIYLFIVALIAFKNRNKFQKDIITLKKNKYIILFITIMTVMLIISSYGYLYLVNNQKAAIVTILTSVYPIITLILGYKYFNETLTRNEFIGFTLVLLGILFINLKN